MNVQQNSKSCGQLLALLTYIIPNTSFGSVRPILAAKVVRSRLVLFAKLALKITKLYTFGCQKWSRDTDLARTTFCMAT